MAKRLSASGATTGKSFREKYRETDLLQGFQSKRITKRIWPLIHQPSSLISKHAKEMGEALPAEPMLFLKPTTSLLSEGAGSIKVCLSTHSLALHHNAALICRAALPHLYFFWLTAPFLSAPACLFAGQDPSCSHGAPS